MKQESRALSQEELQALRSELIERKVRLAGDMNRLSGEAAKSDPHERGETSSMPQHLAELGTESFEQDKDFGLAERAGSAIGEIDRALERLQDEDYGICEACGQRIPRERLQALPSASRCTACQARREAT